MASIDAAAKEAAELRRRCAELEAKAAKHKVHCLYCLIIMLMITLSSRC